MRPSLDPSEAAAVITAAGLSSRMGTLKALLDWSGKPLIQHQIDALAGWGEVIVVLGYEAARLERQILLRPNVRLLVHPGYEAGRASTIQAGIRALATDPRGILVTGVDQPLDPLVLASLLGAQEPGASFVVPTYEGRRGHPVLFSGDLRAELEQVAEVSEGLRAVVRRHAGRSREVPVTIASPLLDLNTPHDYEAARTARQGN